MGEILWVAGTFAGASEHLERALEAAPGDQALAARLYPRLVYFNVAHRPGAGGRARGGGDGDARSRSGLPARWPASSSRGCGQA